MDGTLDQAHAVPLYQATKRDDLILNVATGTEPFKLIFRGKQLNERRPPKTDLNVKSVTDNRCKIALQCATKYNA